MIVDRERILRMRPRARRCCARLRRGSFRQDEVVTYWARPVTWFPGPLYGGRNVQRIFLPYFSALTQRLPSGGHCLNPRCPLAAAADGHSAASKPRPLRVGATKRTPRVKLRVRRPFPLFNTGSGRLFAVDLRETVPSPASLIILLTLDGNFTILRGVSVSIFGNEGIIICASGSRLRGSGWRDDVNRLRPSRWRRGADHRALQRREISQPVS